MVYPGTAGGWASHLDVSLYLCSVMISVNTIEISGIHLDILFIWNRVNSLMTFKKLTSYKRKVHRRTLIFITILPAVMYLAILVMRSWVQFVCPLCRTFLKMFKRSLDGFFCLFVISLLFHVTFVTTIFSGIILPSNTLIMVLLPLCQKIFEYFIFGLLVSLLLFSCQVVSDSSRPHGLQHARLPCPSPSPWVCVNSCPLN